MRHQKRLCNWRTGLPLLLNTMVHPLLIQRGETTGPPAIKLTRLSLSLFLNYARNHQNRKPSGIFRARTTAGGSLVRVSRARVAAHTGKPQLESAVGLAFECLGTGRGRR